MLSGAIVLLAVLGGLWVSGYINGPEEGGRAGRAVRVPANQGSGLMESGERVAQGNPNEFSSVEQAPNITAGTYSGVNSANSSNSGSPTADSSLDGHEVPMPAGFGDFYTLREGEQVEMVNAAMSDPHLSKEVADFFVAALRDRRLGRLVRNNMAAALHNQADKRAFLHETFIASIDDADDIMDWRLYSIQHLAFTYPYTAEPQKVLQKLQDLAHDGEEPLATQAMLMLDDLEHSGQIQSAGIRKAVERRLRDPNADTAARLAALNLIGRRGLDRYIDEVRVAASESSQVQRAAIAALGRIGNQSDLSLLNQLAMSSDPSIADAAKSAQRNIRKQITD